MRRCCGARRSGAAWRAAAGHSRGDLSCATEALSSRGHRGADDARLALAARSIVAEAAGAHDEAAGGPPRSGRAPRGQGQRRRGRAASRRLPGARCPARGRSSAAHLDHELLAARSPLQKASKQNPSFTSQPRGGNSQVPSSSWCTTLTFRCSTRRSRDFLYVIVTVRCGRPGQPFATDSTTVLPKPAIASPSHTIADRPRSASQGRRTRRRERRATVDLAISATSSARWRRSGCPLCAACHDPKKSPSLARRWRRCP